MLAIAAFALAISTPAGLAKNGADDPVGHNAGDDHGGAKKSGGSNSSGKKSSHHSGSSHHGSSHHSSGKTHQ